ncbi:RcpC/CpaB family pilus assembly protein [Streptomyces sp. NPDC088923]|uniref:RcpC/CpaB family pilus assembly protein n=1 Tax=Streptomyces sp. NPDC088923 TaxID=3365913 RepID=UPI00382F05A7
MKVQERVSGRAPAPAQQPAVGERLPSPPRERKPALAALAVLLILAGALAATLLVMNAGDRVSVVRTTKAIPAGGSLSRDNTTDILVAKDESINYLPWDQIDLAKSKYKLRSALPEGSLVVGEMLIAKDKSTVDEGKALVGLALKEGQYPGGLKPGDTVAIYHVGKDAGAPAAGESGSSAGNRTLLSAQADVKDEDGSSKGGEALATGDRTVTVSVPASEAQALAQASSVGEVAVVLVPGRSRD